MPVRDRVRRFLQKPGSANLTRFRRLLPAIGAREEALRQVPDDELASLATKAIADGDTAEYAAVGREAARRALGERPHDVQLLGTLAMLSGYVAEMATGEGKTLSGALAAGGYAHRGHRPFGRSSGVSPAPGLPAAAVTGCGCRRPGGW